MAAKRSSGDALSPEAEKALSALAKRFGVSRNQMIERLIFGTAPEQEAADAG